MLFRSLPKCDRCERGQRDCLMRGEADGAACTGCALSKVRCSLATGGFRGVKRPRAAKAEAMWKVRRIGVVESEDEEEEAGVEPLHDVDDVADKLSHAFWRELHAADRAARRDDARLDREARRDDARRDREARRDDLQMVARELGAIRVMMVQLTAAVETVGRPLRAWLGQDERREQAGLGPRSASSSRSGSRGRTASRSPARSESRDAESGRGEVENAVGGSSEVQVVDVEGPEMMEETMRE